MSQLPCLEVESIFLETRCGFCAAETSQSCFLRVTLPKLLMCFSSLGRYAHFTGDDSKICDGWSQVIEIGRSGLSFIKGNA